MGTCERSRAGAAVDEGRIVIGKRRYRVGVVHLAGVVQIDGHDVRGAATLHLERPETVVSPDVQTALAHQLRRKWDLGGARWVSYSPGVRTPPGSSIVWYQVSALTSSYTES